MKRTTLIMLVVCIILTVVVILVSGINCVREAGTDPVKGYWQVSFIPAVNILFFLWITFFVVQLTTDQRKQKDILLSLIIRLQTLLQSPELLSNEAPSILLMKQREINSVIFAVKSSIIKTTSKKEIDYLQSQMEEYVKITSENLMNVAAFNDNKLEMQRLLSNICNKTNIILINLYNT